MTLNRWTRPLVGVALVGALSLGLADRVSAQDATPVTSDPGVTCTVEPRPVDELLAVWFGPDGSPVPPPTLSESVETAADLPAGTPADEETAAAITATIQEVFACFDSGQITSAYALMSDNALGQFGPDATNPDQDTPEEVRTFIDAQNAASATPTTVEPVNRTVVSDAMEPRILDDGRAGAIFASEGDTVFATFVQSDGTWLFNDIIDILQDATPTAG